MTVLTKDSYISKSCILNPSNKESREYYVGTRFVTLSSGVDESSYSLTLDQPVTLPPLGTPLTQPILASTQQKFMMPDDVVGNVFCKSTNARLGIWMPPTDIEAGWQGYLTLELFNATSNTFTLPLGYPIAAVRFLLLDKKVAAYNGKYQNQPPMPVPAC
jgi:deoxycytidine triphosphate deaminase